jgi:hypothetical protein
MKNHGNDGVKRTSVLWIAVGLATGLVVACGGANSSQGSEPSKTAAAPASSGAAPAAPAGSAAGGNGNGPGPDQIRAVLKDHKSELKACYDKEKDRGMSYRGDTKFQVKIEPTGKVSDVKAIDVTPASEFLSSCVSDLMKGWTFPSSGKVSNVTIPVVW